MENSTGTYPRARDPQNRVQEDERGAPTARPPDPPSEAAHDGAVTNPFCNRTIVCRLRACAPECALTVPAWRVHPLQCMYTYIYSPVRVFRARGLPPDSQTTDVSHEVPRTPM